MAVKDTKGKTSGKSYSKPVASQVKLDANSPIPFEYGGQYFSYVNRSRYIPFLPPNDNFAQMLLEARLLSATHNKCITTKKDYCAGLGFQYENGTDLPQAFKDWCKSVNRRNQSLNKINRKSFESHFTFGNTPIELVRYTVAGKRYFHVYVHNLLEWRLCPEDETGVITHAVHSKLFLRYNSFTGDVIKTSKKLPIYSPYNTEKKNWFKDEFGAERTLLWYKNEFIGYDHYGLPSAVASMIHQVLEYKGARYNLDNFDNNLVVSALLLLKGNLSQGEADRIAKKAISTHVGDGKRGRLVALASEQGIESSDIHNLDTYKEGSFKEIDESWMQKIIMANDWDAVLAGIQTSGSLGKGSGYVTKIIEHLLNTTIKPAQKDLMDEVWAHALKLGNEWMNWGLKVDDLQFKNNIDISGLTDVDITPAVTRNEVRKAKGLPEDSTSAGKEYMKSTGPVVKQNEGGNNV